MTRNTSLVFSFGLTFFWVLFSCTLVLSCATKKPAVNQYPTEESPESVSSGDVSSGDVSSGDESESLSSDDYDEFAYEKAVILEGASSHRVRWGDTLSKLAVRYYGRGNGYYFPLIMLASQGAVKDPDKIISGRVLTIPDLWRNLDDPGSRQLLKEYIGEVANIYAAKPPTRWSGRTRNQLRALASTL